MKWESGITRAPDQDVGQEDHLEQERLFANITVLRAEYQEVRKLLKDFTSPESELLGKPFKTLRDRRKGVNKARDYIKTLQDSFGLLSEGLSQPGTREETLKFLSEFHSEEHTNKQWRKFRREISGAVAHMVVENLEIVRPEWEEDSPELVASTLRLLESALSEAERHLGSKKHEENKKEILNTLGAESERANALSKSLLQTAEGRAKLGHLTSFINRSFRDISREEGGAIRDQIEQLFLTLLMEKAPPKSPQEFEDEWPYDVEHGGIVTPVLDKIAKYGFDSYLEKQAEDPDLKKTWEYDLLLKALARIGLEPDVFLDSVQRSVKPEHAKEGLIKNINAAWRVEAEREGAVKVLSKTFGIQSFGRYPTSMLVHQFDQRDSAIPYGVVIYPREDWNGSFMKGADVFSDLDIASKGVGHGVRIFEAESGFAAMKRLAEANKKYGSEHKIAYALIGAHGDKNAIELSEKKGGVITSEDVLESSRRLSTFFVEKPTVIFDSCLVGEDNGLGETFSNVYGARVLAADVETEVIDEITIEEENGRLNFKVLYEVTSESSSSRLIKNAKVFG